MTNLRTVIEMIRRRPEMYISRRSVNFLRVFLDGYIAALPEEEKSALGQEVRKFQDWLVERFQVGGNQSWNQIVLFYSLNEETSLDRFFDLHDEFSEKGP